MSKFRLRVSARRLTVFAFAFFGGLVAVVVSAAPNPWVQTDWQGGASPGVVTTQVDTFDSASDVDFSVAGEISLPLSTSWPAGMNSWRYRQTVTISNSGSTNTNYPVSFELNTQAAISAAKMNGDCSDIRVTNSAGTELDFWIEGTCNATSTTIWAELDSMPSGDSDIYVYYGNGGAASQSNADEVFQYYVDFNDDGVLSVPSQDIQPTNYAIEDGGRTLYMYGNNWKGSNKGMTINGDGTQLLEVNFRSTDYGEIQGIGFQTGLNLSATNRTYKVGGSQGYGIPWDNAYTDFGNFETISAILNDFSGTFSYLIFANDDDAAPSGDVKYKDVRIRKYQNSPPTGSAASGEEQKYADSGTLLSNVLDAGVPSGWGTLNFTTSEAASVTVKVRTDSNSDMSGAAAWGSCSGIAAGGSLVANSCVNNTDQYLQYQITLTPNGTTTPVFEEISFEYQSSDLVDPVSNASSVAITGISDGSWTNTKPTFTWTAGADNVGGVGLLGYCISLDESDQGSPANLDPELTAGKLAGLDDGVAENYCPFIATGTSLNLDSLGGLSLTSGKQYYFSIKAVDLAGNIWNGSTALYQNLASFIYDNTDPIPPGFISLPGSFVSTKDVTITWPTVGGSAPDDAHSGLAGLQYRIGPAGTWYGANHNGNEDLSDLLAITGAYVTDPTYDYPDLIEGINYIYFRSVDNVGNTSSYVSGVLKLNTVSPGPVQNLSVTPSSNTTNSYAFNWDPPASFSGLESNLTYCYTVNTLPSESTCNFTAGGLTALTADSYATQPGSNTMYVVARDEALNINYDTYTTVMFSYSGTAPGIPGNLEIADISIRAQSDWRLALTWSEPADTGAGIANYQIFRSTTSNSCTTSFGGFSAVGSAAGTSFVDTGLTQSTYYYCVRACDSANNCSAVSSTVSELPTGRYTTPAELISGPTVVDTTTKTASIQWVTERESDSRIRYGLSSGNYFGEEVGNSDQVTSHTVNLSNLTAGTTYYYQARWTDRDGNTGVSEEKIFVTDPPPQVVSNIVTDIRTESVIINLTTRNASKATIQYGKTESFGGTVSIFTSQLETNYAIRLEELEDGSTYFYKIVLEDIEGNSYDTLEINQFETLPRPRISDVEVQEVNNSAQPTLRFNWSSNTDITSVVTFYPEGRTDLTRDEIDLEFKSVHELDVSGLLPNTRYVLLVKGVDQFGNEAVSEIFIFDTAADSRPPEIFNLAVDSSTTNVALGDDEKSQLIVSWETDEPASSQVEFGEGVAATYSRSTVVDQLGKYQHIVVLPDLNPSNVYHLRVVSSDEAGNEAKSSKLITVTPQPGSDTLELVIGRLSEVFSFLN